MKTLFTIILAVLFTSSFANGNNNEPKVSEEQKMINEIRSRIDYPAFDLSNEEAMATVYFLVGKDGKLTVTRVDCSDPKICDHIMTSLNDSRIQSAGDGEQVYSTRVIFKLL